MTAVVLETGAGIAGADSYVSAAEVSTYILDHYGTAAQTTWDAQTEQDRLLRTGSRYIDHVHHRRWGGYRANEGQGLDHPRANQTDSDGYAIASTIVHQSVKDAACEAVYRAQTVDLLPDELTPSGGIGQESVKIGSLAISTTYTGGGQDAIPRFTVIESILAPILDEGGLERG